LAGWIIMLKPDPLADLERTRGIRERVSARGDVITPLDEASARRAVRELIELGAEAITVSLMHSYANPQHEQRVKAIVEEMAPDMTVSLSSEILPEFREYERTLVTVMNAYVRPSMRRYLNGFEEKLHQVQFQPSVNIVRSDGGLMSVERASQSPVHTMLSGPAGGVSGAAFMASLAGFPQALGFDMGGTSTDVSLIEDGKPTISRQTAIGYYPIKVPSVDVHSVGAGGGSIAHVPMTGALRVGPESAGAVPGPACYGKGGDRPTVTDANVVLRPAAATPSRRQNDARREGRGRRGRRQDRAYAEPRPSSSGARHLRHRQREHARRAAARNGAKRPRSQRFRAGPIWRRRTLAR
jgi:N-methylhydantoinase A